MKVTIDEKEYDVQRISISAKCSDLCYAELQDKDGAYVAEHVGYVPALMPDEHYGDYVILDIDLETGVILNWKRPDRATVEKTDWEVKE